MHHREPRQKVSLPKEKGSLKTKTARGRSLCVGCVALALLSDQVHKHGRAGLLSFSERLKRRAADLCGRNFSFNLASHGAKIDG
jgi:hypothetical protein